MGSSTGLLFRVTTFGESHGGAIGAVVEGCPPRLALDLHAIQRELDRRKPGQSSITTQRKESDRLQVLSGLADGLTLGTPIALLIPNEDADSRAYEPFRDKYRPSHADFTYDTKYGVRAWAGGGRASARETAARVAAGAVAKQALAALCGVEILAWVEQVGALRAEVDPETVTMEQIEANVVRCPDAEAAAKMEALIREVRADGDTIGGVIRCVARNVPAGLGDPVFDKLEAELARAMLSLPACKGFESGSGFAGVSQRGSAHNDAFISVDGQVRTSTNRSGGIQGGISNGMPILFGAAFKPVATIFKPQDTVNDAGEAVTLMPRGRHDPCVLPRAVPMVEAGAAMVLLDQLLRQRGQVGALGPAPR